MSEPRELRMLFRSQEDEDEYIADGNLEMLLENYQPSLLSQVDVTKDPNRIVKDCRDHDILIGRFVSHPGNILARKVIQSNREFFRSLETDDRKEAVDATIAFFESKGSRFLEPVGVKDNGTYKLSTHFSVAEKFRKSLRETGVRADRPGKKPAPLKNKRAATAKPATKKFAPFKVQKKVKSTSRGAPPPPRASSKSRGVQPIVFTPQQVKTGDRLAIWWPEDGVYYPGTVIRIVGTEVRFHYDDGEREKIDLTRHNFVILSNAQTTAATSSGKRARRVSLPSKPSPENSIITQSSSGSHSIEAEPVPIQLQGTFRGGQAAAGTSLASYLKAKFERAT